MKYAMPVHPKVLEKDYETNLAILFDLKTLTKKLKEIDSFRYSKKGPEHNILLRALNKFLYKTWFQINKKKGINLRDREKLVPLFKEMNRVFGGAYYSDTLYRGVRLSKVLGPTDLSDTYPNSINDPKVVSHLESLAYGLRSWTKNEGVATHWASGTADGRGEIKDRDLVIFQLKSTEVVLDADKVLEYYYTNKNRDFINEFPMVDVDEVIVNIKNPKVVNIKRSSRWFDVSTEIRFFLVEIEDMG